MSLKIGELARRAGLTVRTLRHYDQIGLLTPSSRSQGDFRLYDQEDVIRLFRIQMLKGCGFSLEKIGELLDAEAHDPAGVVEGQMAAIRLRIAESKKLLSRLEAVRVRLAQQDGSALEDWLSVLEMMVLCERHLSPRQLDALQRRSAERKTSFSASWAALGKRIAQAMEAGELPDGDVGRQLARECTMLLRETTGNDPRLAQKLARMIEMEDSKGMALGFTKTMLSWISRARVAVRDALLGAHLSPEEMAIVRVRQAAHRQEWPRLLDDVRRAVESGVAVDSPAAAYLATHWERLFCQSYAGDDKALAERVRTAFKAEPQLMEGLGMEARLVDFVRRAGAASQLFRTPEATVPPKATALRVARYRAVHQLLDAPVVFDDPLALKIIGPAEEAELRDSLDKCNHPLLRGVRVSTVTRTRFAEDAWAEARAEGVRQYVVLGAGLDTFAYRDTTGDESRIFEVDLPATQRWKRELLRDAGIPEPGNLAFVPIDFESESLLERLADAGAVLDQPVFFSWLGVTMYLGDTAIEQTLRSVSACVPGSSIVFDYAVIPELLTERERNSQGKIAARAAEQGEPWKSFFAPAVLLDRLRGMGFAEVLDFGPEELNARYLSGRTDGLRKSGLTRLLRVRV